nr:unnamed protein product [Haemonchus contortus]
MPRVIEYMVPDHEIHDYVIKTSLGITIMQDGAVLERKSIPLSVPIPWSRKDLNDEPVCMCIQTKYTKKEEATAKKPKIGKRAKTLKKAMAPKAKSAKK